MKYLFIIILFLFSCNASQTKEEVPNCSKESFLCAAGKTVEVVDLSEKIRLEKTKIHSVKDTIPTLLHDDDESYAWKRLNASNYYRRSENKKYYLTYSFKTYDNVLYKTDGTRIGSIKLEANNPEFYMETLPLEEEEGILYVDGVYGFKKYEWQKGAFKKTIDVKVEPETQISNHLILSGENQLLTLKRTHVNHKTVVEIYALDSGEMILSKEMDYKYYQVKHLAEDGLLVFYGKHGLLVTDKELSKDLFEWSGTINSDFAIKQIDGEIIGLVKEKNGFRQFNYQAGVLDTVVFKLKENNNVHRLFMTEAYHGMTYFETKEHKITKQGVLVFNKNTDQFYKINIPEKDLISHLTVVEDTVQLSVNKINYSFLLKPLAEE